MNGRVARSLIVAGVVVLALLAMGQFLGATQVAHASDGPPIFVSTDKPGMTEDGVEYGREDVLVYYSATWSLAFDGTEYGLKASRHNINAFALPWLNGGRENGDLYEAMLSFSTPRTSVPDIPVRVYAQDVVMFEAGPVRADGGASFWFMIDGSDIGLNSAAEAIDSLSWYPTETFSDTPFFDYPCEYGFFAISTVGPYAVPTAANGIKEPKVFLKGFGSDILLFCPSELGYTTHGYWFKLFDSKQGGITPRNAVDSISLMMLEPEVSRADADLAYYLEWAQTAKRSYTAPGFTGPGVAADPSELVFGQAQSVDGMQISDFDYMWDFNGEYPRLNGKVDALEIAWYYLK